MVDRLRVTELDFDTIKQNLKTFLNQQSEFSDYDFEGSGLSIFNLANSSKPFNASSGVGL